MTRQIDQEPKSGFFDFINFCDNFTLNFSKMLCKHFILRNPVSSQTVSSCFKCSSKYHIAGKARQKVMLLQGSSNERVYTRSNKQKSPTIVNRDILQTMELIRRTTEK